MPDLANTAATADDVSVVDAPANESAERSRAELLRLLRNEGYATPGHPHPTPRFFPDRSPPVSADIDEQPGRGEAPISSRRNDERRRRKIPSRGSRRRRSRGSGRSLWFATAAMLAVAVTAGAGLFYIATTGRDLPGTAGLALAGDAIGRLWPGNDGAGKADPAGHVESAMVRKSTLVALGGKPVVTVHLDVADASGVAMQPIALHLGIAGAPTGSDMAIALYGLPEAARLNAGARRPDGGWLIPAAATSDLRLTMPAPAKGPITLSAAVTDATTGALASPYKEFHLTVTGKLTSAKMAPASAMPAGSGAAVFTQGLEAMLAGDVKAARALFRQAIELGEPRAIVHLARSYDPLVLAHLKSSNAAANRERAIAWYKRAIVAGNGSVKSEIAALETQHKAP